ncbi:MAG: FkbM family methyltransferase [Hyphomonadaceae bacterium]|nr:FkbM family methyltransferase [Hyphomonadaceae bacterium]
MSLPRISRRRRRWLNEALPPTVKHWVTAQDPFYLLAEHNDVIDRSIEIIRERAAIKAAPDRLFCDLGFNNRRVFDRFYDALGLEFRWCGLELQPALHAAALNDAARYRENPVDFVHAAATTRDGSIDIALDGKDDGYHPNDGSTTVLAIARDKSPARRLTVPGVDLAQFLLSRSTPQTRIVVKMDVEGAEYELLPHLLESSVMERLDLVLCEFHWRRFPAPGNVSRLFQTEAMIAAYRARGCLLLSWR